MWKRKKRVSPDKKGESFLEKGKKLAGKINGKEGRTVRKITVIIKKIFRGTGGNTINDLKNAFGHINPRKAILAVGGAVVVIYLLTGIYIVSPGEQAVIRRFGVVQVQPVEEGLHYRLPFPIDQVQKVNVSEVRRADVGMSLPEHVHQPEEEPQAIQLLTGDENIITTQAVVHYKVVDAAKFLYNINGSSEQLVRYSVESALVRMMANTAVDDVLSSEKVVAQNNILQIAQNILDKYDSGMQITAFNIKSIVPPGEVSDSFLDVTTAKEEKETAINEANGYSNSLIPQARADAEKKISAAEAYKEEQISRATGDTEKFLSMLKEYQNNSAIYTEDTTKYRLLLETLDKILPTVKMYIVDSSGGNVDVKLFDPSLQSGMNITDSSGVQAQDSGN